MFCNSCFRICWFLSYVHILFPMFTLHKLFSIATRITFNLWWPKFVIYFDFFHYIINYIYILLDFVHLYLPWWAGFMIVSTLAPQINYIYILLMLGCIGAKLGGLYEDDAKMDANCIHFSIPNKLHLNSTCARLSRCKTRHII